MAEDILGLLTDWVEGERPNTWVITKVLSGSWAAERAEGSLATLRKLVLKGGAEKQVIQALEAMARHGAKEQVKEAMDVWRAENNPELQAIAKRVE